MSAKNYIALTIFVIGIAVGVLLNLIPPFTWLGAPFLGFYYCTFFKSKEYDLKISLLLFLLFLGVFVGAFLIVLIYVYLSVVSLKILEIVLFTIVSPVLFLLGIGVGNIVIKIKKHYKAAVNKN